MVRAVTGDVSNSWPSLAQGHFPVSRFLCFARGAAQIALDGGRAHARGRALLLVQDVAGDTPATCLAGGLQDPKHAPQRSRGVGTCNPPANYQTARGHGVNADQLPQGVLRARAAARKGQWSVLTGARPAPMPAARNFTRVTRRAPQFAAAARWCSQRPRGPCAPGAASSSPSASTLRGPSQRSRRDAAMASRASAVARVSR